MRLLNITLVKLIKFNLVIYDTHVFVLGDSSLIVEIKVSGSTFGL